MKTKGTVTGIVSNLVTVEVDGPVAENEICYIDLQGVKMMAEVIKVNGKYASVQVFESTRGLRCGDAVEFEGRTFPAPSNYHAYLTGLYKDYMQLPPEDQRMTHDMTAYLEEQEGDGKL